MIYSLQLYIIINWFVSLFQHIPTRYCLHVIKDKSANSSSLDNKVFLYMYINVYDIQICIFFYFYLSAVRLTQRRIYDESR